MTTNSNEYMREYKKRLKYTNKGRFNNQCASCHSKYALEFAHKVNGAIGMGRGSMNRHLDIFNNPDTYLLLCVDCHRKYDRK